MQPLLNICELQGAPVAVYEAHNACSLNRRKGTSSTAFKTLPAACEASMASCILGRVKTTGLSFIGGAMRSIQSLRAMLSPSNAFAIAVWVKASAWPSSRLSIAIVALLREPLGRPAFPSENLPSVFLPFCIFNNNINLGYLKALASKYVVQKNEADHLS